MVYKEGLRVEKEVLPKKYGAQGEERGSTMGRGGLPLKEGRALTGGESHRG